MFQNRFLLALFLTIASLVPRDGVTHSSPPFADETDAVDNIYAEALSPDKRPVVIAKLKGIVESTTCDAYVRGYALEKLGDLDAPELQPYLLSLATNKPAIDAHQELRNPAYLAYWKIKVNQQKDAERQIDLLTDALDAKIEGLIANNVRWWAAQELCNRGAQRALPAITNYIKHADSSKEGDLAIQLCALKMQVLSSYPTRLQSLAASLEMKNPVEDSRFKRWAVQELMKLGSEEANNELAKYALKLQETSPTGGTQNLHYTIVKHLRKRGWSGQRVKSFGIRPTW